MRKRKSKTLQALAFIEDFLVFFNDYCDKHTSPNQLRRHLWSGYKKQAPYFVKKGILNPDFTFKQKPKSFLSLIKRPWDKKWRFIVFDIPQENKSDRERIRRQIRKMGFRQLQRSVWFSPLPLNIYLEKLDKQIDKHEYLTIIKGQITNSDPKKIIAEKWEISNWQEKAKVWLKNHTGETLTNKKQKKFWDLILDHPKVPLDLLPHSWPFKKVMKTYLNLMGRSLH